LQLRIRGVSVSKQSHLANLLIGGIAGAIATAAMTATARRLLQRLPPRERYPLPPRELVDRTFRPPQRWGPALTLLAHFGFGSAAGALHGLRTARVKRSGILYGLVVWTVSYFGWVPALGLLTPADRHPARRTAIMIASHIVWGAALDMALAELRSSARTAFASGPSRDAPAFKKLTPRLQLVTRRSAGGKTDKRLGGSHVSAGQGDAQ
jgi:hypothetical protein